MWQKKEVEREGLAIVEAIMPEDTENWQTATAQKAIKKHKGVDQFFKAVTDYYQFPIIVAHGTSKQRLIKEEQRPYLETTKIKIYGADYLKDMQTDYACLGFKRAQKRFTNLYCPTKNIQET